MTISKCPDRRPAQRFAILLALAVLLAGCQGEAPTETTDTPAAPAADRLAAGSAPRSAEKGPTVVQIETSAGTLAIRLDAEKAPATVRNFLNHVASGFYNGTMFHYVDAGRTILAGGFAADGSPKPVRPMIRNEAHNGLKNVRGSVAMSRDHSLVDSASTQFFINLQDSPQRDHQGDSPEEYGYCVFGEVIEGLDVADRISQSPTEDRGGELVQTPQPPVVIRTMRVVR